MEQEELVVRYMGRWVGWACVVCGLSAPVVVSVVSLATQGWQGAGALVTFVVGGAFAFAGWRFCSVPKIAATESGIAVDNPFGRALVPWQDVTDIVPGPSGLVIRRRDGRSTIAWAVQKDNLSGWLHKRTPADEVAEALLRMADEHNRLDPASGLRLGSLAPGT